MYERTQENGQGGYSLLELLVVCALSAILAQSALSGFPAMMRSIARNTARQQLEFDLSRIRAEAIAQGARAVFLPTAGGTSYSAGLDFLPFHASVASDEDLFGRELPDGVTLSLSTAFAFSSAGYVVDATGALTTVTVTLSDDEGTILSGRIYPIGSLEYDS